MRTDNFHFNACDVVHFWKCDHLRLWLPMVCINLESLANYRAPSVKSKVVDFDAISEPVDAIPKAKGREIIMTIERKSDLADSLKFTPKPVEGRDI